MIEIIVALSICNLMTVYWAFFHRISASKESIQMIRAIKSFEREHETILRIEKLDPDQIFLRNPGR